MDESRLQARVRVIVVGVRDGEEAARVAGCGVDGVGVEFGALDDAGVSPEDAYDALRALPPLVASVGVFRDVDVDEFGDVEQVCPTAQVILLGEADAETLHACGPDILRGVVWNAATLQSDVLRQAASDDVGAMCVELPSYAAALGTVDWEQIAHAVTVVTKPVLVAVRVERAGVAQGQVDAGAGAALACAARARRAGVFGFVVVLEGDAALTDAACGHFKKVVAQCAGAEA